MIGALLALSAVLPATPAGSAGVPARIGFLIAETLAVEGSRIEALRAGLRDHGYVEGKNMVIELRPANGNYDRLADLAMELVSLKVDVIVAFGTKAVSAARRATTTIPIVDPVMGDPVASGLSSSFARPERNVTGSTLYGPEVIAKKLDLLKESVPRITRVAAFLNPANASSPLQVKTMRATAKELKLELQVLEVRNASDIGSAFAKVAQEHFHAVVVGTDTLFRANAVDIAERAARQRLPSIGSIEFAAAGGLIGYGPDPVELYRHAAYFVDKIVRGAKPADLPIERPTKLTLVVNLKSAKALGVTIPQALLVRADEVIQ